jgi:uncharacterized protein (DUF1800 family)
MHAMKVWANLAAAVLTVASPLASARVHDKIFGAGRFETITDLPPDANAAARFLTQATFGPVPADITKVMTLGYSEWIDEEEGMLTTLSEPSVENTSTLRGTTLGTGQSTRVDRWLWQATYAPDQLRQRMAYELSQIFVVSDQSTAINNDVIPMAAYQDLLANDAFAIYVNLLHDITYNPTMSKFLSTFHNQKANCSGTSPNITCTTLPDENYAREVMQLFSIGLIELDLNGEPMGGIETPTYDQTVITHTAKVFTGFTYSDAPTSGTPNFFGGGVTTAATYAPMACWGSELFGLSNSNMRHDITGDDLTAGTSKTVLDGNTLPPNRSCAQDVGDELNIINEHPNVAPFISKQLIQRFVTSNPSDAYVQRVAMVFENNGLNERGDLGDVLKAVLTDQDATTAPSLVAGDTYGKLREPLLRLTAMWRAFNAVPAKADAYGEVPMTGGVNILGAFGQAPLEAPTVFNFYPPDFEQQGALADAGKVSPEFALINEASVYALGNAFNQFTQNAYVGMTNPKTDRPLINLSSLTVNANNSAALVATINSKMLYGTMSVSLQSRLSSMIDNLAGVSANEIAWSAIYLTMLSPEYATQR